MLTVVIVAALVAVTAANSASDIYPPQVITRSRISQQCAGYCKDSSKFSLRPDSTYVYSYEGTTTSGVPGATNETSVIKITAKAHVQVTASPCELILQIHEARLLDSGISGLQSAERQREFAKVLEANPLRFSYQDGRVEQLCPAAEEAVWALNLKRGLLSAFQNSMADLSKDAHLYERDVSGSCETTYTVMPMTWSDVQILKNKDLYSCSGRGHQTLGLPGTFSAKAKSVPIIKSEQFCEQTIKSDKGTYLSSSRCQETHIFAPFSNGQSGIRTTAELSLSLDNILQSAEPILTDMFVNKRTNLQFEFSSTSAETPVTEDNVWFTLKQLVTYSQQGVDSQMPKLFDVLVRQLASLGEQQLVKIFDQQREEQARKFLLDALPLVGSSGSVQAMYQIYAAREVSRDELESWLTALSFHKQPSLEMLDTLQLFMQDGYHPRTWLAVSAVVNSYCRLDPACADTPQVQAIMSTLEQTLGQSCLSTTREQQETVVVALKAIGNMGFISSLSVLRNCFMSEGNPMEVRLAAVAATRRFPCDQLQNQLPMLLLFQEHSQDTELRIAAYLAAAQCPDTATISRLREVLYKEDTNQVLSFVWTHLTNLQESTSIWKQEIRQMLQDNYLANKFKTDARKFSRNYEMSAYSDILNTGATIDSNVVFSTKSYLPRSATLNLTLDLFGEAVNIFEIGTRLEGFESVVEDLFSPKGYFPDEGMQKMLKNMRSPEDSKNDVIQTFSEQFTKATVNEPQGQMFARIFGNELFVTQFYDLNKFLSMKPASKYSFKYFLESLSSLFANNNIDYTKSFRFINTEYIIPTIVGLPLHLEVNGTAAVGMQLNTKVDVENLLKTKTGYVGLSFNPSAALQIDGKMIVDAVFTRAGIETKGSLNSNTYLDTKISIERGQIIDLVVNVPRDKVEILNVKSAVYINRRSMLREIKGVGDLSEHDTCLGKRLPTISGMRVCSQYTVRNASGTENSPYFPLTGKFQYALAIQKSDSFDSYEVHLKQMFDLNSGRYSGKFVLEVDTPGSKLNRRLLADLAFNSKSGEANLDLKSPVGSVQLSGKLGVSPVDRFLDLRARVDDKDYATLGFRLQTENSARTIKYAPSLLVQAQPNLHVNITGQLNIVLGHKYSADLFAAGLTKEPITVFADVMSAKGRYGASLIAKAEAVDVKISTRIITSPTVTSCKTLARYVLGHQPVQNVDFMARLQHHKKGSFSKRQLLLNLQMSELPQFSSKLGWILYRTEKYFDSSIELKVGKTEWKSQQLYHNSLQERNKNFELLLSLASPTKNLDYRVELQYKTTDETMHSHALAQLSEMNRFITRLDYKHDRPLHSLELEMATPWQRAALEGRMETPVSTDPSSQVFNGNVTVKWSEIGNPRWVMASGQYKVAETALSTRHTVKGSLEGKGWDQPLLMEGMWAARSGEGMILSDSKMSVTINQETYKLNVAYIKDIPEGKHDLKAILELPKSTYSSNIVLINKQGLKNIIVRLDLEKTLYFTSQLEMWKAFDMQLFWNYLEDRSQSVLVKYRNNIESEIAVLSMPGHYASLTVDKLGPGFSSMNITAIWGENEGSANNAILLTTYWVLDMAPLYEGMLLPTVHTSVYLQTPFVGFEHQSFEFNINGTTQMGMVDDCLVHSATRVVDVSTKWQDQFIGFHSIQVSNIITSLITEKIDASSTFTADISSSLDILKILNIRIDFQNQRDAIATTLEKSCAIEAAYNNWTVFTFNSTYTPGNLLISTGLLKKSDSEVIISGEISLIKNTIFLRATLPLNEKIDFTCQYNWPISFMASLTTPYKGYEESAIQYNIQIDDEIVDTKVFAKIDKDFLLFAINLEKPESGYKGVLNITSSSYLPDLAVELEHELRKSHQESYIKEFASVTLTKNGKVMKSGRALLSFADEQTSPSSRTKSLQTVIELPSHYLSSNYTYQSQIKLSGVEVNHYLIHSWNEDKIEVSLSYEGMSVINGLMKRNNDKKFELLFINPGNGNYRTDIALPSGYSVKHLLFFTDYTTWQHSLVVSTPHHRVIVKNSQSANAEMTDLVHKSTILLDTKVAYIDVVVKLDSDNHKVESILFSTTTPWTHPAMVKYNLLIDTGATSKHQIQLKYKEDQEIKVEFDITSTELQYSTSFNVHSPYCNQLGGKFHFEVNKRNSKANAILWMDDKRLTSEIELAQNVDNPSFSVSVNNSNQNIIRVFCTYDITSPLNKAKLMASYFDQKINVEGNFSLERNGLKAGFIAEMPIADWQKTSVDFNSVLSQKDLTFALNAAINEKHLILSGKNTLERNSLVINLFLEHTFTGEVQTKSVLFNCNRGINNGIVMTVYKNNDVNVFEVNIKYLKEHGKGNDQISYLISYGALLPFENIKNSSLNIKIIPNNWKQIISGSANINDWYVTIKGENTFNFSGTGYLNLKYSAPRHKSELYIKRVVDDKDTYTWHISNNSDFISGTISISKEDHSLQAVYDMTSSITDMKSMHGILEARTTSISSDFESSLHVNNNKYVLNYSVLNGKTFNDITKHDLFVSLPIEGFANVRSTLDYRIAGLEPIYVKVEITDGSTVNKMFYHASAYNIREADFDLPALFRLTARQTPRSVVISTNTTSGTLPNFSLNFNFNSNGDVEFETESYWTGKVKLTMTEISEKDDVFKILVVYDMNDLHSNAVLQLNYNFMMVEFHSNIPDWREFCVLYKIIDRENYNFSFTVSKNREELFYSIVEGLYTKPKGELVLSVTMQNLFIDVNVKYNLNSNFSVDLKFNVNGNKQHAGGTISFLPDTTRIDLATPIKGFEDMTLVSSLNRRNKKAGLIFQRNGKTLNIELSATVESKLIVLKGTVTNGEDEFTVSVGAQKGTDNESSSTYIHAFKNKKSIFWLSLEGSDNLQKTAGLKFSFSSLYHHQRYFEITSNKEDSKHTFFVSYLHGADFTYSLNMTIVRIIAMPHLVFSLQLGPHVSSFEARYDAISAKKTVAIKFEQNKETIFGIEGEIRVSMQTSKVEFNTENKNLLGTLKSMKILGEYNFDQESLVMTTLEVNDVKYFNLLLRSNSLYDVQFLSSLVSSNHINTAFDISLIYRLALPNSSILSVVEMNGDYYKCTANLTWTDISAETFFHLNTSAGYGFENAVLSAKYSADEHAKYLHLINFFVDDSTLFHVSSDISYPNQMSLDLILPDSLFLPFVKQINIGFNFTEEAKTVLFKYLSKSDERRSITFSLLLQNYYCDINLNRSEMNDEKILQSDKFKFSYSIRRDLAVYLSSLTWENDNIFSIFYVWEDSSNVVKSKHSLPEMLFNLQNTHVLNITAALSSHKVFELAGILSPFELLFHLKHPSITKTGLSELNYTRTLGDKMYMKVYYENSEELTQMGLKYTDIIEEIIDFFANSNGNKFIIFTNLTLHIHDKVLSLVQKDECEDLITAGVFTLCSKIKHQSKWMDMTNKQQSLDYSLDLTDKEILGAISTASDNYRFSGKFTKHSIFNSFLCSNFSFNLFDEHELKNPFEFIFENNCENNLYVSLNVFEENPHDVRVAIDKIANQLNGIKIHGKNFPFIGDWFFRSKISDHVTVFEIAMKKNWVSIEWHNASNKHCLTIESSFDEFKKLEIMRIMNEENRKQMGTLKFIGLKSWEWEYTVVNYKDGSIFCHITSDQNIEVNITLNLNNKKELILKMLKNEKLYESKGLYQVMPNGEKIIGEGYFTLDGILYSLNFERLVKPEEHKSLVEVKTPTDDYYVELYMNRLSQKIDPSVIVRYKTPFYPLDYADIKVWFNHYTDNSNDEFSLSELNLTHEKVELYNKIIKVVTLSTSVKTHSINIDKAQLDISYEGKYGINLSVLSKQVLFELYPYDNKLSCALQSTFKVSGFDMPVFNHLGRKIVFRAYVSKIKGNAFAYLQYHIDTSLILVMKKAVTKENQNSISYKFGELLFNKNSVLKINLKSCNGSYYYGNVQGEWEGETLLLDYNVQEQDSKFQMKLGRKNKPGIDATFYYHRKISTDSWIRSFELNAIELLSLQDVNPKIIITKDINNLSIVKYELQFNNGLLTDNLFFSGNCSISYPDLESLSLDSSPKLHANILFESVSRQYAAIADFMLQRNKMDATVKWKRIMKSVTYKQNKEYMTLKFGGLIMNKSAEFYLNENKFAGFIESSSTQSVVSAHLFNDRLKKNMTVFASVQYSPIYLLTISHTVFDSPCSVEVKVDRRLQSLETAVTIIYNHLTQQAFINVYLDSNPQYAELMYLDIWQQTHEASVYVEEKDNEVTVRGKINSPAIDENFLIVTVGLNSDKFEMNMNDDFIFKAFKDNTSGLLNLVIFGNNYQLQCSHENEVRLSLMSPIGNGIVTISSKELRDSFASFLFVSELCHILLEVNTNNILTMALSKREENIFDITLDILNSDEVFQLQFQSYMFGERNGLNIKHVRNPILFVVSLTSSQFLKHNLDIMLGIKKEDLVTGIFEIKQNSTLFKSYIGLCRQNNSLEINIEAPLFSQMDKAKLNGVFNVFHPRASELKFSAALYSEDIQLYESSFYLTKDNHIFTSGLVVKRKNQEDIQITLLLPLMFFLDFKFVLQLPSIDYYELGLDFCSPSIANDNTLIILLFRREDYIVKINLKAGDNPFYFDYREVDIQYSTSRVRIGAGLRPIDPRTDYKYFVEWNGKCMLQISHAYFVQTSHFKSKFTIETSLKGHEKYGIDLELQNQLFGKVVKLIGSAPQLGNDLGVDFEFHYDSLLNYAILAQIRIPYENQVKMLRIYSLHKIHPNINMGKLNYTFECTDLGVIGLGIDVHGSAPFMLQGKMLAVESRLNLNNNIFLLIAKSFLQSKKIQLDFGLETPFEGLKKGEVRFSGTQQIVGSEFVVSLNSNDLIKVNITEDATSKKELKILSKWRNVVFNYKYKVDEEVDIDGYICWDLLNRNISQFGVAMNAANNNKKHKYVVELLFPSLLVPKLGLKSNIEHNINRVFSLVQLDLPGLLLEGKLASEISTGMYNSGVQLRWATTSDKEPKNIAVFYVKEINEDEIKHYFTLQHFSLPDDLILTTYTRSTLYGINLRYSPVKEEEITLEFGYWMNRDNKQEKSGVKFVVIHQATNTLVFSVANFTTDSDITEGGFSIAYLTDQDVNKAKYLAVYGKKNKKTPGIYVGLTSNGNSIGLGGSLWNKDNHLRGLTIETKVNEKDPLKLEVVQNLADPSIEVELSYSLSRRYRIFAGMPNNNEMTAKLSHTMYGKPSLDAFASLRLNTSRILWGRFELPPMTQVGQEFYSGVLEEYSDITLVSQAVLSGFSDFLQEDFSKKIALLFDAISNQADIIVSQTHVEVELVVKSVEVMGDIAQQLYDEDHFYLKTCFQYLKHSGLSIYSYMSCAFEVVFNVTRNVFGPLFDIAQRVWVVMESVLAQWRTFIREAGFGGESPVKHLSKLVDNYQQFRHSLMGYVRQAVATAQVQLTQLEQRSVDILTEAELAVNQLIRHIQHTLALYLQRAIDYKDTILAGFSVLGDTVQGMIEIVIDGIYQIEEVSDGLDRLIRCIEVVKYWYRNFRLDVYIGQIDAYIDRILHLVASDIERNFGEYEVYLVQAKDLLEGQYEEVSKIPQVHYMKNAVIQVYEKVKWFWNYARLTERLRGAMKQYFENMKANLDELDKQLDREEGELRSEYIYNAENNSLTFTQELPFEWRAFNQLPDYKTDKNSNPLSFPAQEYSNMVHTMANYLWQDAKLLPYILPPFGSDAIISGNSFITFDDTFYLFRGGCGSYLLASDLYHNTFSLLANYDEQNKRDILLITGELEILVKNNLEVHVNGKLEDMPLVLNSGKQLTLERKIHSVLIKSSEGFSLECSSFQDMCKFHLDGWYMGKTAGLLGTYNHEPSDDFVSPDRQLSGNIREFIDSWSIEAKQCETEIDLSSSVEDSRHYEMCEMFFSSQSSPFLPCFHVVDPKSFSEMCLSTASHDSTCSAVMAYLTKCTSAGVQLWMPEFCVDSSISKVFRQSEFPDFIEVPAKMSADVVFIMEEADCLSSDKLSFGVLLANLNSDLNAKGLTDNKFALISFNSKKVQIHTINGEVWTGDEKKLEAAVNRIETSEGPSLYTSALQFAANLPYRPGATKAAVLVHCSDCPNTENYGGLLERFSRSDITLHVLQSAHLSGHKGKGVSKVIGLEKSGAYPRKRLFRNASPDPQLLHQVSAPQDLCTPLVFGTNGTLFEMDVGRKGVKVWSGRVADGASQLSDWQQCENSVGEDNIPMWRCRRSHSHRLKDWDMIALHEYMDISNGEDIYPEYGDDER